MNNQAVRRPVITGVNTFQLGSFEGFNIRKKCPIGRLDAQKVVEWNHEEAGEAEFWPSGDHAGVALVFRSQAAVKAIEIVYLDQLLIELGGDSMENFLRVLYLQKAHTPDLAGLSPDMMELQDVHVYVDQNLKDLRRKAAHDLFKRLYPFEHGVWLQDPDSGLVLNEDGFLRSNRFEISEVRMGRHVGLIVVR